MVLSLVLKWEIYWWIRTNISKVCENLDSTNVSHFSLTFVKFLQKGPYPKFICYDNSCQLHKFCSKRVKTSESSFLDNEIFVIDRLHAQGHVEICKEIYHPSLYKELENCNTMICEQRNYWISSFKHITKHMNQYRFNFFIFVIFNYYNEIKSEGIINITKAVDITTFESHKRKFAFLYSEDDLSDDQSPPTKK